MVAIRALRLQAVQQFFLQEKRATDAALLCAVALAVEAVASAFVRGSLLISKENIAAALGNSPLAHRASEYLVTIVCYLTFRSPDLAKEYCEPIGYGQEVRGRAAWLFKTKAVKLHRDGLLCLANDRLRSSPSQLESLCRELNIRRSLTRLPLPRVTQPQISIRTTTRTGSIAALQGRWQHSCPSLGSLEVHGKVVTFACGLQVSLQVRASKLLIHKWQAPLKESTENTIVWKNGQETCSWSRIGAGEVDVSKGAVP